MKKGLLILGLVCVFSFGLAGCGSGNAGTAMVQQDDVSNAVTMEADAPNLNASAEDDDAEDTTADTAADTEAAATDSGAADTGEVTEAQAKEIALKDAGFSADDVTAIRAKKDRDDGRVVYDVEFYVGNKEYDYEIEVSTGKILEKDFDIDDDFYDVSAASADIISTDKAIEIVLKRVSGATKNDVWIELDEDDGHLIYEGEIHYKNKEYEFELNAKDGSVLEWSEDYDD